MSLSIWCILFKKNNAVISVIAYFKAISVVLKSGLMCYKNMAPMPYLGISFLKPIFSRCKYIFIGLESRLNTGFAGLC